MGRTGRPSKLTQVVRTRDDGTEVTAGDQVVERVQLGLDLQTAADSAGIDRSTIHRWRLAGARHRADQTQGKLKRPTANQQALIDFCNALERAEAEAELNRLGVVQRAAQGGYQRRKVVSKIQRVQDARTGEWIEVEVERTETSELAEPQWTAAAWWLERKRGYVKRMELTGAEGQPLVPQPEQARNLADSMREYLEGVEDGKAMAKADA